MNKIYLAAVTGAALTAFAGIANAQGTGTSSGSTGTASNLCWDLSSNMARDKNQTSASGTSSRTLAARSAPRRPGGPWAPAPLAQEAPAAVQVPAPALVCAPPECRTAN